MARRIAKSSINWPAIAERVQETDRHLLGAFRVKSDQYLRRMMANPESSPKIDWAFYKKNVAVAGMVDKFQKQYESLQIPYPADNYTSKVEEQEKIVLARIKEFIEESNQRIREHEAEVAKVKATLPYEEMTMEDWKDAHPDLALDPLNKPSLWPHGPEDQPGSNPHEPKYRF